MCLNLRFSILILRLAEGWKAVDFERSGRFLDLLLDHPAIRETRERTVHGRTRAARFAAQRFHARVAHATLTVRVLSEHESHQHFGRIEVAWGMLNDPGDDLYAHVLSFDGTVGIGRSLFQASERAVSAGGSHTPALL